jgi:four helix bundle protein
MSSEGLKRLQVWVKSKDFAVKIYQQILPYLPESEKYVLHQQLRRACTSISANIAEGYGRYYYQDNLRFCYIARGSLEETISFLVIAAELHFLPDEKTNEILHQADQLVQIINGYIAYLKRTKQGETEKSTVKAAHEESATYEPEGVEDEII